MLFSLASFRTPVSHQIQRYLLSSLPAARAIQQCASWRTRAVLDLPGDTGVLRRDARGELPFPQVSGLIERKSRPGGIAGVVAQDFLRQPRQQPAELLPRPFMPAEQGLHPVRPLMPGLLGKFPAVRPRLPRQRPDVVHCRRDGPPLPHHPAQQVTDQRVCSLAVLRGIFYAGHCGRGRVLFSHKIQERATAAPRCAPALPAAAARSRYGPLHQPHAGQSRNKQHASTQRETATVILVATNSFYQAVDQVYLKTGRNEQFDQHEHVRSAITALQDAYVYLTISAGSDVRQRAREYNVTLYNLQRAARGADSNSWPDLEHETHEARKRLREAMRAELGIHD